MNIDINQPKLGLSTVMPDPQPFLFEAGLIDERGVFCSRFYLLGSQHNLPKNFLGQGLGALLSKCDVLVKEITGSAFGDASDIPVKELKLHGLFSEKNEQWTEYLGAEARKHFDLHIKDAIKTSWGSEPHHISPVVVNHVISDWGLADSYGEGMDLFIENQFLSEGKPVLALEDGQIRFDAYNTLFHLNSANRKQSLKDHVASLEQTILSWANPKQTEHREDLSNFEGYFSGNLSETCSFDKAEHLCKRNLAWIKAMERYLEQYPEQTLMFMCGFAHLGGTYGILNLLKNIGYEIRKVS